MHDSALIIPDLNPTSQLIKYVSELITHGFKKIILIDNGGNEACREIFENIKTHPECDILTHTVNIGKRRNVKRHIRLLSVYICGYVWRSYSSARLYFF